MLPKNRNRRDRLSSLIKNLPRALIETREAMDREQIAAEQVVGALGEAKETIPRMVVHVLYQDVDRWQMETLNVSKKPMATASMQLHSNMGQIMILQIFCLFNNVKIAPHEYLGVIVVRCNGQERVSLPIIPGVVITSDIAPMIRAKILSGHVDVTVFLE